MSFVFNPSSTVYRQCTGFIFGWLMWSVHLTHFICFILFIFCSHTEQIVIDWPVCATFLAATFLAEFYLVQLHSCYIGQWFLRMVISIYIYIFLFVCLLWHLTVCYWLTSLCHIPGSHIPGSHIPGWVFFCTAPQLLHWPVISKEADFNYFFICCSHI